VRVIAMYPGAALLVVCGALCLYGGIGGQPRDSGHALSKASRSRLFGPLIVMGIALWFGACLCLGDAISVPGTKSNAGLVMMAIAGAGLIPTALLFCSLRLFGRPKFLMSQDTPGGGPAARHVGQGIRGMGAVTCLRLPVYDKRGVGG
jgi:hypothetical protein